MKKNFRFIVPLSLLLTISTNCFNAYSKEFSTKVISSKRIKSENDSQYANKLARIGEILLSNSKNLELANLMFDKALKADATNSKALFYSAFTEVLLNGQGFYKHAESFLDKEKLEELKLNILKYNFPELLDLAFNLPENIKQLKTKSDVLDFLKVNVLPSAKNAVEKISSIKTDLELIIDSSTIRTSKTSTTVPSCETTTTGDTTDVYCEDQVVTTVTQKLDPVGIKIKLQAADLEIIKGSFKTLVNSLRIATAYNLKNTEAIIKSINVRETTLNRKLTHKEVSIIVAKFPQFLTLNNDHELDQVSISLEDTVASALNFAEMRDVLCDEKARANYLFGTLCMNAQTEDNLAKGLEYLAGPKEHYLGKNSKNEDVTILININSLFQSPLADLKVLFPAKYDTQGRGIWDADNKITGLFPNADFSKKINQVVKE